ncbi:MAG: hypothetical protein U0R69_13550 [Gaiellales bacterium]
MLVFVGLKMTLADVVKLPVYVSLGVIVATLVAAVVASLLHAEPRRGVGESALTGTEEAA